MNEIPQNKIPFQNFICVTVHLNVHSKLEASRTDLPLLSYIDSANHNSQLVAQLKFTGDLQSIEL